MGPDEGKRNDTDPLDTEFDELLSRERPRERSDDLYDGEW
jgi:hypothetical protein